MSPALGDVTLCVCLVDIRDVPSEMPIYLLAEDEGNEEEILRLLESETPGGSPCVRSPFNSSPEENERLSPSHAEDSPVASLQSSPQKDPVQHHQVDGEHYMEYSGIPKCEHVQDQVKLSWLGGCSG